MYEFAWRNELRSPLWTGSDASRLNATIESIAVMERTVSRLIEQNCLQVRLQSLHAVQPQLVGNNLGDEQSSPFEHFPLLRRLRADPPLNIIDSRWNYESEW